MALDLQYKRIADFIASYYVYVGGAEAIVFTAGIGENSPRCRQLICDRLAVLGVKLDPKKIKFEELQQKLVLLIQNQSFLIPTNEELMIARDTFKLANL